jgi:autotransporter-associated beta strand protein
VASIATHSLSIGLGGDQNITGGGTLTVNLASGTKTYEGRITDGATATSLIKEGSGTQVLNNLSGTPNSYTGNTTVNGGTLSMSTATLADGSTVSIATGAVLNLTHSGTDRVAVLKFNNVVKAPGIYHQANSGGFITGTGSIQVGGDYASWAIANGISGEPASGDYDKDGISNLVEYALGKDPNVSSQPAGVHSGNTLTFTKGSNAIANGDVSWVIETSTTLTGSWTPQVTQAAGNPASMISYTFTPGSPSRNFARLKVTQN